MVYISTIHHSLSSSVHVDVDKKPTVSTASTSINRINLNIVLNRRHSHDEDSEADSGPSDVIKDSAKISSKIGLVKTNPIVNRNRPLNTTNAFRLNCGVDVSTCPAPPRIRRPLVRAMSAPIRTTESPQLQHQQQQQAKNQRFKKIPNGRRRRMNKGSSFGPINLGDSDSQPVINCALNNHDNEEECVGDLLDDPQRIINNKTSKCKTITRTTGCDIVTLVSLLSGSDSEDNTSADSVALSQQQLQQSTTEKPGLLRKTGKSVSFQEHANQNFPAPKDFPVMFRRGSVAPLAARIRAHRPPTAPPGSLFITDIGEKMARRQSVAKIEPAKQCRSTNIPGQTVVEDAESNDSLKSAKERECYKLFQKMTNRGISVSYDTILRGMLTPTELRIIQKQREVTELQLEADGKRAGSSSTIASTESGTKGK